MKFKVGDKVRHKKYGVGRIIRIDCEDDGTPYFVTMEDRLDWWCTENNLELVEEENMTYKEYLDRKKTEILNQLQPIADALNTKVDYVFDLENNREYLICDSQKICTNSTSVEGIVNEFWGYVSFTKYKRHHHFEKHHLNAIRWYWYDDDFNQPWLES